MATKKGADAPDTPLRYCAVKPRSTLDLPAGLAPEREAAIIVGSSK